MARGEITEVVGLSTTGSGIDGASVEVRKRSNNTLATVYAAETGSTTVTNPLFSVRGRIEGWLDEGSYLANISKTGVIQPYTVSFEIVNGDTVASSETAISTHIPATTNVHGIADTSHLITIENIGTYAPAPDFTPYARLDGAAFTGNITLGGSQVVTAANIGTYAPAPDLTPYVKKDGSTPITGAQEFQSTITKTTGGVSKWSVDASGNVSQAGGVSASGSVTAAAGGQSITVGNVGGVPGLSFGADNTTYLQRTATGQITFQGQNPATQTTLTVKGVGATNNNADPFAVQRGSDSFLLFSVGRLGDVSASGTIAAGSATSIGGVGPAGESAIKFAGDANAVLYRPGAGVVAASKDFQATTTKLTNSSAGVVVLNVADGLGLGAPASENASVNAFWSLALNGQRSSSLAPIAGLGTGVAHVIATLIKPAVSGLVVRGAPSQSATLQEWQDSTPTTLASVDNSGAFSAPFFGAGNIKIQNSFGSEGASLIFGPASHFAVSTHQAGGLRMRGIGTNKTNIRVQGVSGQGATDYLQEWWSDTTQMATMGPDATLQLKGGQKVNWTLSTEMVVGWSSVTSNAQAGFSFGAAGGDLALWRTAAGQATFQAAGANATKIIVKGTASQASTNLFEVQDSTPTTKAYVSPTGVIHSTTDVEAENKIVANVLTANRVRVGFDGVSSIAGMAIGSSNDIILNRLAAGVLSLSANTTYPTAPTMTGAGLIIQNVTTAPSTNPVGGPVVYADAGDLAVRGPSGAGNVKVAQAGKGITLTSPDGSITRTLTLTNDGALDLS